MNRRINRTLLNWRWWVGFPVIVALLPVALIDCALGALVTTGHVARDLQVWMRRKAARPIRWIRNGDVSAEAAGK